MPDNGTPKSLAVLIDADNTSARYAQPIFEEIVTLGEANVRRIYGDFSNARLDGWDGAIKSLAILQNQQRSNTKGKNASDIALVIDRSSSMQYDDLEAGKTRLDVVKEVVAVCSGAWGRHGYEGARLEER